MTKTVLILGPSGKIGSHAARAFAQAGWAVRTYRRGTDMTTAAFGADVIVNGLNPPNYHNWSAIIPAITAQVISAAKASGASVILPGNVYNYGDIGGIWSEATPHRPCTRKGRIRVEMEAAYRASGVRTIVLRAGNFIDPDHNGDMMSAVIMAPIAKGRLRAMGPVDVTQPYAYLPDWARAAAALADRRDTLAVFEDIPFPGHAFTLDALRQEVSKSLVRTVRIEQFPWWVMTLTAPFWELARELREMRYLSNLPHRLDGSKLARLLPDFEPSTLRTAMLAGLPSQIHPDEVMRPRGEAIAAK